MRLTFLLCALLGVITAAAVTYGYMNPPEEVTAPAKNVPITEPYHSEYEESSPPSSPEMPRFVYDEPLTEQPVTAVEPSSSEIEAPSPATASSAPESSSAPSEPSSLPQAEPPVVIVPTPTTDDIAEVSAEHLRELDALIGRLTSSLDLLAQQALADYHMLPDPDSKLQLSILAARYLPQVYEIERDTDAEAKEIFSNFTSALDEIGADNTPAAEAKVRYEAAKAAQLNFYKELAASYSVEIG